MKFTKREKVLLYMLLCVLLIVGSIFFLILPSYEKYNDLKASHQTAELELQSARASIIDYTDLDKQIKQTAKELKNIKKKFYAEMKKEEVDSLITNLVIEHGLTPSSLSVTDATKESVISYETFTKNSNASSNESTNQLKVYNVNMTVSGTILNLQTLVNDANKSKTLKVASVNYSEQESDEKEMTVTFKVFMI